VLVAHCDDETVGRGALLQSMPEPMVMFVTDSAPRDQYFRGPYGSRQAYLRLRPEEARRALACAGVADFDFLPNHQAPFVWQWPITGNQLCAAFADRESVRRERAA
jgi:LmbE family N-acetylglucosaminyl deacetylase